MERRQATAKHGHGERAGDSTLHSKEVVLTIKERGTMTPTEVAHAIMGPMAEKAFQKHEPLTVDEVQKLMCLLGTYKLALETVCTDAATGMSGTLDGLEASSVVAAQRRKAGYDATNDALLQAEARLIEMGQVNLVSPKRGIHLVN